MSAGRSFGALTMAALLSTSALGSGAHAQTAPVGAAAAPQKHEEITLKTGAVMIYDKNVPIPLRDGSIVYANVYRPKAPGRFPVIMGQSPYGKDATFQDAYASQWKRLSADHPTLCGQSSCRFIRWEHTDPERWVGDGYVVMQVDVRGVGYTPGRLDMLSKPETEDYYDAIEWAGTQPWSNGKVGLLGISYLAMNQWMVAALNPPHLAAIAPYEGASDIYRESQAHGGILSNLFTQLWFKNQILPNQNGNGKTTYIDPDTGTAPTGAPLSDAALVANRVDPIEKAHAHPLLDSLTRESNADLAAIKTPLLSAGNMSAAGLHGRGNYEGFVQASSTHKWLMLHTGTHDDSFYSDEGVALQHRFFDRFLKGADNGWDKTPPVTLVVRDQHHMPYALRPEQTWPLKRTRWTRMHLDAGAMSLNKAEPSTSASTVFDAGKTSAQFTLPFTEDTEITGPVAAHLWVASSTTDADLFLTLQIFDETGQEITYLGASDNASPLAQGWLRASQRKLDQVRTKPYQPWHPHNEVQKLVPGQAYPVDVEIWPTSVVAHPGYRLVLTVAGADFVRPATSPTHGPPVNRGSGVFLHTDPLDRPLPEFGGKTTVITGAGKDSYLTLPIIPTTSAH